VQALLLEDGVVALRDVPEPEPPDGEALVRVLCAGVCATDLELTRGYSAFRGVLGHEFVGVVERGPMGLLGRRVVGDINASCGDCAGCRARRPTHCERRTVLGIVGRDGAFAEKLALPARNLHVVPPHVTDEIAVFAEPLAAALQVTEQVQIRPADRVLVLGAGRLGQLVARVLRRTKCELVVAGGHPDKLRLLEEARIRTVRPEAVDAPVFDVVVECTGNPAGFELARRAVRPRGTIVLKSTYAGELTVDASAIVVDEITLVGSRCGPIARALALLADGEIDPRPLVHARYPLKDAVAALRKASSPGVLKVLIDVTRIEPGSPRDRGSRAATRGASA
jgi:threonine dehydrogenase-like Zn-dependent dehydrogenase